MPTSPTDYPALVYARVFACIQAGAVAYNAAVATATAGQPLYGFRPVDLNAGLIDDATTGRLQVRLGSADAKAYPRVGAKLTGGSQPAPKAVTFGFIQGAAGCDAILPRTVMWSEVVEHDPAATSDSATTPIEAYIDAAFDSAQPKLAVAASGTSAALAGLPYLRSFSRTHVRRDEIGSAGGTQTVRRTTGVAELWPHVNG